MIVKTDKDLYQFEAWADAKFTLEFLVDHYDDEEIQQVIEECWPDGIDETELNDLLWFDKDTIAEWLGFESWDQYTADREKEEEGQQ